MKTQYRNRADVAVALVDLVMSALVSSLTKFILSKAFKNSL